MTRREAVEAIELTEYEVTQVKKRVVQKLQTPDIVARGKKQKSRTELYRIAIGDLLFCENLECFADKIHSLSENLRNSTATLHPDTKIAFRLGNGVIVVSYVGEESDEALGLESLKLRSETRQCCNVHYMRQKRESVWLKLKTKNVESINAAT